MARPFLWLDLVGPNGSVRTQGIVDSGADFSCLPYGYASLLGYQPADLTELQGTQVQGAMTLYRAATPIRALLPGDMPRNTFELHPNFVENADMILWGRLDFFRVFSVVFTETMQQFTLVRPH